MHFKIIYQKYKQLIPVVIFIALYINIIVDGIKGVINVNIKHDMVLFAIIINTLSFLFFKKYYKYVLAITLLLGLFNVIGFKPTGVMFFLKIGKVKLIFQPIILLIIILVYIINYKRINSFIKTHANFLPEKNLEQERQIALEEIERFKLKYSSSSNEELNNIIKGRYIPTAIEAAQQILDERKINSL